MDNQEQGSFMYGNAMMAAPSQPLIFPSNLEFVGKSPSHHGELFARAPWFHHAAFRNEPLIFAYIVESNSNLPGNLPVSSVLARGWKIHGAIPRGFAKVHAPQRPFGGFVRYCQLVYSRMYRTPGRTVIPSELRLDLGRYRFDREIPYAEKLSELEWPSDWETKEPQVRQSALVLGPQLPAEFRYSRKVYRDKRFWDLIRWERSARSRLGVFVPFMNVEVDMVRRERLRELYLPVPEEWAEVETCSGFLVPLPPVLSYSMTELLSPGVSGLWTVMYTEFVAIAAAMWLWELYDTHRMWFLSTKMRQFMGELDLRTVLGGAANESEFRELLQISADLNWDDPNVCPPTNRKYNVNTAVYSPGRRHSTCGDWVWFDPRQRVPVTNEEAAHLRNNMPAMPPGHATGYRLAFDEPLGFAPMMAEQNPAGEEPIGAEIMEEEDNVGEVTPISATVAAGQTASANVPAAGSSAVQSGSSTTSQEAATRLVLVGLLQDCGVPQEDLDAPTSELRERVKAILASKSQSTAEKTQGTAVTGPSASTGKEDSPDKSA